MGFSVSGSAAILFIAAFVCVGILYSAAYNGYERVQDADGSYDDRMLEQRNTAVNVTNATYNASGNGLVTVNVTNHGSTSLSVNDTDLLVDGVFEPRDDYVDWNVEGQSDTTLWLPGESYNITIDVGNPDRVKIVTGPGVTETATVEGT
ncbi:fla cluster protein FlaF [Halobacterium noricense]|uniref:fla cluster protein FlaF n=1 Tax=Halobacterium noricense TaxID=223182 RepID=UPI001E5E9AE5|nr:fla cluster protein FlaF [Halobacterium noricense]UHH26400.1 fla cluster protein FlaF [Halobacterium noricense]